MAKSPERLPLVLIAGPTASGKSALGLAFAEKHGGTIINADSAQVYAQLRLLSARPSADEEARVPHRLFGHVDGAAPYSAPQWAAEAKAAIAEAHRSGRVPVLVGGTGMYLRTLFDGIAPVPPIDAAIRAAARSMPVAEAYAALGAEDPASAARLKPTDTTRIARALEIVRSTGRPIGAWQRELAGGIAGAFRLSAIVLLPDRGWLRARCDQRFDAMMEQGALDEVRALAGRNDIPPLAPVRQAIGVRELSALLGGTLDRETALDRAKAATRQYAKRQYTWFRNQLPTDWRRIDTIDLDEQLDLLEESYNNDA